MQIEKVEEHQYKVKFKYDTEILFYIKDLPERVYNAADKSWTINGGSTNYWIRKFLEFVTKEKQLKIDIDKEVLKEIYDYGIEASDEPKINSNFESWEHQKKMYQYVYPRKTAMLNCGMGTGKTKVAVDLITNRNHKKVLVVAPKSVCDVWKPQFELFQNDTSYRVINVTKIKGSVDSKIKKIKMQISGRKKFILIINYDVVWRKPAMDFLRKQNWDFIILDESHRIKSNYSKVSKALYQLAEAKSDCYKLALTGTPLPNNPLDVFGQYRFLDKALFGSRWYPFFHRYTITKRIPVQDRNVDIIKGYKNEAEMNRLMNEIMLEVSRDVLDLPEAQSIMRTFDLEPKEMKMYNELKKESVLIFNEQKAMSAQHVLTRLIRLQQVVSGYGVDDDTKEKFEVGKSKINLLDDMLMDYDKKEPLVIFCRFREDISRIREVCKKNKRSVAELSGKMNELEAFQNGEKDTIVVQIQSGSMGIDLTRARYCIYYSLDFSLGNYEQSKARVHRPGQKQEVIYYHLVANNTIDEKIYKALQQKKEIINEIMHYGMNLPF